MDRGSTAPITGPASRGRPPAPAILTAISRAAAALVFVAAGLPKLAGHATWAAHFRHWHVPLPGPAAYVVGSYEVIGGTLLLLGVATEVVAALFVIDMTGALLFAGLTDGGQYILEPVVLGTLCVLFARRGGGAWQLLAGPGWPALRRRASRSGAG